MQGQLVLEQNINTDMQVDVQSLTQGFYTLQLKNSNGMLVQVQKIAKL